MPRYWPDRREMLQTTSGLAAALLTQMAVRGCALPGQGADEELVPFLDMPRTPPNRLDWEMLQDWMTPQDQVFNVQHYDIPAIEAKEFTLEITGLVRQPRRWTLEELKKLPRAEQVMTLECSGNGSSKGFLNAVYNSCWGGTFLAPLLKTCAIRPEAIEVVFIGKDHGRETLRKGTPREATFDVPFGCSMSVADAMNLNLLLAYERNGQPLEKRNGGPLRLIVPGWYGIANVKWLSRIELRDRRYMGRFMGRDYVTVRGERRGEEIVPVETSVTRMNLKSIIARVTRRPTQDGVVPVKAYGAVWGDGTEVKKVEVQVDDQSWREASPVRWTPLSNEAPPQTDKM